jgi:succinate-semialdehyde dehydrogenase/glutarate-semialdehyde dehydrogenase
VYGGQIPATTGAFYPPTLLTIGDRDNIAFTEELFGPVCTVIKAENKTEAIDMANDSNFGLGAALFTENLALGHQIIREELQAGAVFLNEFVKSDPRIAFGGIKQSGYGREMGKEGIYAFVNKKYLKY